MLPEGLGHIRGAGGISGTGAECVKVQEEQSLFSDDDEEELTQVVLGGGQGSMLPAVLGPRPDGHLAEPGH